MRTVNFFRERFIGKDAVSRKVWPFFSRDSVTLLMFKERPAVINDWFFDPSVVEFRENFIFYEIIRVNVQDITPQRVWIKLGYNFSESVFKRHKYSLASISQIKRSFYLMQYVSRLCDMSKFLYIATIISCVAKITSILVLFSPGKAIL